jgi:hypothetical protein
MVCLGSDSHSGSMAWCLQPAGIYDQICFLSVAKVFPCFFLSCKANDRVYSLRLGTANTLPNLLFVFFFVIHVLLLLIVMFYVLFMCKCVLPPGANPIAVDKYINININIINNHAASTVTKRGCVRCQNVSPCHLLCPNLCYFVSYFACYVVMWQTCCHITT